MIVTVANHSAGPFRGWVRTTVDEQPRVGHGANYVLGQRCGREVWALDLHVDLAPHEVRDVELIEAPPGTAAAIPPNLLQHFGGVPTVCGQPLTMLALRANGAAWEVHAQRRVGRLFVVDVWFRWRPAEPWVMTAEATVTASNPAFPDVVEAVPPGGIAVRWGDAVVWNSLLAREGETFVDGQARTMALVLAWTRHIATPEAWMHVHAAVHRTVCAVGLRELWAGQGRPRLPAVFDPVAWTRARWARALAAQGTFLTPVTGPNKNAADSGEQGDQVFVGGEMFAQPGPEQVRLLSAYQLASRPNHYRRADGSPLDPSDKPGVMFWHSRPHDATHDLLGKDRGISPTDTDGWWGPDDEHWTLNELVAVARATGSPALQAELDQQARLFLFSKTLPDRPWFTSGPGASRAVGWECIVAVHLWENLADRQLAMRVRERCIQRIEQVFVPAFQDKDFWDVRVGDPRLGDGARWIPWQQAVGAYGLDLASERFGLPAGRAVALHGAQAVLRDAWSEVADRWVSRPSGVPATPQPGGPADESFNYFGMCLAPVVVLKHHPDSLMPRQLWNFLVANATLPKHFAWFPPEMFR